MYQNVKLGNYHMEHQAQWTALLLRALPDDLRDKPVATGYPSPAEIADMLERHVDQDGLAAYLKSHQGDSFLTREGNVMGWAWASYGNACFYPDYFMSQSLLPSEAYDGIHDAFMDSDAIRWFYAKKRIVTGLGYLEIAERMNWEAREYARDYQSYKKPPWTGHIPRIRGHYAHISISDPTKIAYTPSPEYGQRNRKVTIRPGRYLKQFYPHISDAEIARLVGDMGRDYSEYDLAFAASADDIERVYKRGPNSCMSKSADIYDSHCHPVRVYGDSDLKLAYLQLKKDQRITARALVWPEAKKIGRIYGDILRLRKMLTDLGYDQEDEMGKDLMGAKIRRIHDTNHPDRLVMPYIDGTQSYRVVDKDWVEIDDASENACYQNGLDGEPDSCSYSCEHCGDGVHEDDAYSVMTSRRNVETWCIGCYENNSTRCEHSHENIANDEARAVLVPSRYASEGYMSQDWASWVVDDNAYYCDHLEEYVSDSVEAFDMENGERWSAFAFKKDGIEVDGLYYAKADLAKEEPALAPSESDAWLSQHNAFAVSKSWLEVTAKAQSYYWDWEAGRNAEALRKQELAQALAA
jgi:hypothetical protein